MTYSLKVRILIACALGKAVVCLFMSNSQTQHPSNSCKRKRSSLTNASTTGIKVNHITTSKRKEKRYAAKSVSNAHFFTSYLAILFDVQSCFLSEVWCIWNNILSTIFGLETMYLDGMAIQVWRRKLPVDSRK